MWVHPYVACMGLVLFHARAVFSVGAYRLFPQCMPAVIHLIGSVTGGVTKACTGYSARPPLCYAQPKVSTLISAPLCMGSLLVPAPRAQQGGSRGVCSQCLQRNRMPWQPCPSLQMPLNSGTSLSSCVWQVQASSYTLCCSHTTLEAISL